MASKPIASLSLDLDNLWTYLKVHGDAHWEDYPSYLPVFVPIILKFFERWNQKITFFVVGQDALQPQNAEPLAMLAKAGHEIGNHSMGHEPWMQNYGEDRVTKEIGGAEEAIGAVTGCKLVGFRGPGYSRSETMLRVLAGRGYEYDTSMLPSILGPLARLYYFWGTRVARESREDRSDLFGHMSDGFLPLKAFLWKTDKGSLVELPVTTVPVFRVPFHLSYLLWLSRYSKAFALAYFRMALILCRLRGVQPCYLLHPLDFLGKEDAPGLSFFPGMDLPRAHKMEMADAFMRIYKKYFQIVPVCEHARWASSAKALKERNPADFFRSGVKSSAAKEDAKPA